MTKERIEAIKRRVEKATLGPWGICGEGDEPYVSYSVDNPAFYVAADCKKCDAEFIAAARTDVPALVAEVERLQEKLGNLTHILKGKTTIKL